MSPPAVNALARAGEDDEADARRRAPSSAKRCASWSRAASDTRFSLPGSSSVIVATRGAVASTPKPS